MYEKMDQQRLDFPLPNPTRREQAGLTLIFLSEDLGQIHTCTDSSLPIFRLERESRLANSLDRGKLEEITSKNDLEAKVENVTQAIPAALIVSSFQKKSRKVAENGDIAKSIWSHLDTTPRLSWFLSH